MWLSFCSNKSNYLSEFKKYTLVLSSNVLAVWLSGIGNPVLISTSFCIFSVWFLHVFFRQNLALGTVVLLFVCAYVTFYFQHVVTLPFYRDFRNDVPVMSISQRKLAWCVVWSFILDNIYLADAWLFWHLIFSVQYSQTKTNYDL